MPRHWLLVASLLFLMSCKQKVIDLSGDVKVSAKDFFAAFKPIDLPFVIADTNAEKLTDTTLISKYVFTQFVPDSVLADFVNAKVKDLHIYPVGSIAKEDENYILAAIVQKKKRTIAAFLFNKKNVYLASLQLLASRKSDGYMHSVSVNREPTFTIGREKGTNGGTNLLYTRNGYAYNSAVAAFIKVVDDSNEGKQHNDEVINPIDTLPRKNKFSADYAMNSKNFISVRDGRNANTYTFFMHFEQDDEDGNDCNGELKGEMKVIAENKALYQVSGDPCEIDFLFNEDGEIVVKERGNCGNHRGIKCYFDDTYPKRKIKKPKKS